MSDIRLQEATEVSIITTESRSKYRTIILQVLEYFEQNPDIDIAKLSCEFGADADKIAKKIRDWLRDDEDITIKKMGKTVYFMRNSYE